MGSKHAVLLKNLCYIENSDWLQSDRTQHLEKTYKKQTKNTQAQQMFTAVISQRQDGWMFTVPTVHSPGTLWSYEDPMKWLEYKHRFNVDWKCYSYFCMQWIFMELLLPLNGLQPICPSPDQWSVFPNHFRIRFIGQVCARKTRNSTPVGLPTSNQDCTNRVHLP